MKKAFVIALVAGSIATSCKKDRTCTCTSQTVSSTSTDPNYVYTPQPAENSTTKYTKIKKKNAELFCVTAEETHTYNDASYSNGTLTNYQVTQVQKTTCTLK